MNKPTVIVEVRGGLVVGVCTSHAVNVIVVDHDTEGSVDEENIRQFPLAKGRTEGVFVADWRDASVRSPGFVKAALKTLKL